MTVCPNWQLSATAWPETSPESAGTSPIKWFGDQVCCCIWMNIEVINICLILKGVELWMRLRMSRKSWRIRLALLSLSRYGVRILYKSRTIEFKALQNDIVDITNEKFKFEKVLPVLEELNATGDNKVILWYVKKFCTFSKFSKTLDVSVPSIILLP